MPKQLKLTYWLYKLFMLDSPNINPIIFMFLVKAMEVSMFPPWLIKYINGIKMEKIQLIYKV